MGSFNVGCGLSNLSINEGDQIGFVILGVNPRKKYARDRVKLPDGGARFRVYVTDDYRPFLPPVYGTYDDYGRIVNIEETVTSKLIEEMFDRPVETVLNCIGAGHEVYSPYSEIHQNYILDGHLLKDRNASVEDNLLAVGFEKDNEVSTNDVQVYLFEGYQLIFEKPYWAVKKVANDAILVDHVLPYSGDADEVLSTFAYYTNVYPGFDRKHWEAVRLLNEFSGMFFLKDILVKMTDVIQNDFFVERGNKEFKENWDEFMNEFTATGSTERLRFASSWNTQTNRFLRDYSALEPQHYDSLYVYKDNYEFQQVSDLINVCTSTNRMLAPTISGEQYGNDDASRALANMTLEVLDERKKRWDDEDYEEDELEEESSL